MDGLIDGWRDGLMEGWVGELMDRWTDSLMDGWSSGCVRFVKIVPLRCLFLFFSSRFFFPCVNSVSTLLSF